MTVHVVVYVYVNDHDMIAAYRAKAVDALTKHGGVVVQRTDDPQRLEGKIEAPTMAVIVAFPDREAAMAWYNDPDLVELHALRTGSGSSNVMLF